MARFQCPLHEWPRRSCLWWNGFCGAMQVFTRLKAGRCTTNVPAAVSTRFGFCLAPGQGPNQNSRPKLWFAVVVVRHKNAEIGNFCSGRMCYLRCLDFGQGSRGSIVRNCGRSDLEDCIAHLPSLAGHNSHNEPRLLKFPLGYIDPWPQGRQTQPLPPCHSGTRGVTRTV